MKNEIEPLLKLKPTPSQNKIAIFKGYYIGCFLDLEKAMENGIIDFLTYNMDGTTSFSDFKNKNNNRIVLEYNVLGTEAATTNFKITFLKALFEINFPNFERKGLTSFINLIKKLQEFRNMVAHNPATVKGYTIIIKKSKSDLKSTQVKNENKKGPPKTTYNYNPYFFESRITPKEKSHLFYQVKTSEFVIRQLCHLHSVRNLDEESAMRILIVKILNDNELYKNGVINLLPKN